MRKGTVTAACCDSNVVSKSVTNSTSSSEVSMSEKIICDRNALIFPQVESGVQTITDTTDTADEPDAFYELTVADLRMLQGYLHKQATSERFLVSRRYVADQNKQRKQTAFLHTVVRFVFVNGDIVQALFLSSEPASHLYDFIKSLLSDQTLTFVLSFGLNQNIENDENKSLIDMEVSPSSRLYVRFTKKDLDYGTLIAKNTLKSSSRSDADKCSKEWLAANSTFIPFEPTLEHVQKISGVPGSSSRSFVTQKLASEKAPKWFRKQ